MRSKKGMRRVSARTARKQKARFLAAYAKIGNATATAEATGISRDKHKHWLERSQEYREAFEAADDQATEVLEQEARRRALDGRDEPVYWNGQQVGTVKKFSDVLLIFLLKSKRPDVYRDSYQTKINNNLNVQTAVKVIHEYHNAQPAVDVYELNPLPNKQLMAPTELPTISEDKAGQPGHTIPPKPDDPA